MNRSPIGPYIMIMVFGIVLVFGLSLKGLSDADEKANGGKEEDTEVVVSSTEEMYTEYTCISCHGENYEGGMAPALKGVGKKLSEDEIKEIIQNGTDGGMPGGLVPEENLDEMAKWLAGL